MVDEQRIDPREPVAAVEIVEFQTVLEGERHHCRLRWCGALCGASGSRVLSVNKGGLTIYRIVRVHTKGVARARVRRGSLLLNTRKKQEHGSIGLSSTLLKGELEIRAFGCDCPVTKSAGTSGTRRAPFQNRQNFIRFGITCPAFFDRDVCRSA